MKRDAIPFLGTSAAVEDTIAPRWVEALPPFVATLLLIVFAYASTAWAMVDTWYRSATFTHGFVVAPICAWLVYRRRARLAALDPRAAPPVLAFMVLLGVAWLVGAFAGVNALSQFAFVGMIVLMVPALLGRDVAYEIAFPLAFLFFAVPVGDFLLPALMERTADFTVWALRSTGVPVYREGLLLILPTGRWSIVEACSGVRYLIASLMVGTLFAYLNYRSYWRRAAFIAFAAAVPIVANWIRAYLIVMLGHLSNNRLAVGVDHLIYGWIFFGIVMALMFWAGTCWQEPQKKQVRVVQQSRGTTTGHRAVARFWPVAVAAIGIASIWPAIDFATRISPSSAPILLRVDAPAGWHAVSNDTSFSPHYDSPSGEWRGAWERRGERAHLDIAYYRGQTPQRKLVGGANPLVRDDDTSWIRAMSSARRIALGGTERRITETLLHGPGGRRILVWQWYWVDGTVTASDALAKARIGWLRMAHRRDDAAAIVLWADDESGQGAKTLESFAREAWPAISASLVRTTAGAS